MRIIQVEEKWGTSLSIGRQNENLATRLVFPIQAWRETFGANGVFTLLAQRPGETTPYPVGITEDENAVYWDVTNADTAKAGTGRCELHYYVGDTLAKSQVWLTQVRASLGAAGEAPEPCANWLEEMETKAADLERYSSEAREAANQAASSAAAAQGKGSGLTDDIKTTLLQLVQKVAYTDQNGQTYYDALYNALYPPATLVSISATFVQGSHAVHDTDELESLRPHLTVTGNYDNGSTRAVTNYTLSGTLTEGTSTITVSYGGKTTTFTVTVTAAPTLSSITAAYAQSGTVYTTDALDSLKSDLVVTATYSDSSTAVVAAADYTLSGTLTEGTSIITVSYEGKTATFAVTVTSDREGMSYVYSDGDLIKLSAGIATSGGYFGINPNDGYRRRTFVLDHGEQPLTDTSTGEGSGYYPIPIPQSATSVTITITPETQYFGPRLLKLNNGAYSTVTDVGWKLHTHTQEFVAGSADYLTINCKYDSGGYQYPVEPTELTIEFR